MKRITFIILIFLLIFDIFLSLAINADVIRLQSEYFKLEEEVMAKRKIAEKIERENSHLTSLQNIKERAEIMALKEDTTRFVFVGKAKFAMR